MTDPNVTKERGQKQGPSLKSLDFNSFEDTHTSSNFQNLIINTKCHKLPIKFRLPLHKFNHSEKSIVKSPLMTDQGQIKNRHSTSIQQLFLSDCIFEPL